MRLMLCKKHQIDLEHRRSSIPTRASQFTAEDFTAVVLGKVVLGSGAKLSMDGKGAWRDNVFVERAWRSG